MVEISIGSYGNYSSGNYGSHCQEVTVGELTLYFSYKTVVAFHTPKTGLRVHKNDWGMTTGKHLNWIDNGDKSSRLDSEKFEEELNAVLKEHNLTV